MHLGSLLRSGRENVEVCPSLAEVEHPAYHAPHIVVRKGVVVLVVDHGRVETYPVEDQWHDVLDHPAARHGRVGEDSTSVMYFSFTKLKKSPSAAIEMSGRYAMAKSSTFSMCFSAVDDTSMWGKEQ